MVHIGQPVDAKLDGMFLIFIRTLFIDVLYPEVGLAFHEKKPIKAFEIIGSALDPSAQVSKNILTVKELLAPLARDEVKLVRCLGLNYADHAVSSYVQSHEHIHTYSPNHKPRQKRDYRSHRE